MQVAIRVGSWELHPAPISRERDTETETDTGLGMDFESSKSTPRDRLIPTKPLLTILLVPLNSATPW